ncbi:hypothetical protein HK096_009968, partial [Nowakowskiella sp. JEL0078]
MTESFKSKFELVEKEKNYAESEVLKLSDIISNEMGHQNIRQKIKHVSQLKEENLFLKKENLTMSTQRDDFRRKCMNLERELESYRAIPIREGGSESISIRNHSIGGMVTSSDARLSINSGNPPTVKKTVSKGGRLLSLLSRAKHGEPEIQNEETDETKMENPESIGTSLFVA